MKRVNIYEARTRFSELVKRVEETGEAITVCRKNKPVVDLVVHRGVPDGFDPLVQDRSLKGSAKYIGDPLASTEDLWPEAQR